MIDILLSQCHVFSASATVVPCLTTLVSMYGGDDQKGTIMGVFRSLGALARALGPVVASTGRMIELLRGLDKRGIWC